MTQPQQHPTIQDAEVVRRGIETARATLIKEAGFVTTLFLDDANAALSRILAENERLRSEREDIGAAIGFDYADMRREVERLREKLAGYEGLGRSVPRIRQALSPTEEPRWSQ